MRGRKPLPSNVVRLRGNPGKRRLNHAEPRPAPRVPPCPACLGDEARKEWQRLAKELGELGLLTRLDRGLLAAYCQAHALWVEAVSSIERYGTMIKSPNGYPMQSPYVAVANKQVEIMVRIAAELGMTPSSRTPDPGRREGARGSVRGVPAGPWLERPETTRSRPTRAPWPRGRSSPTASSGWPARVISTTCPRPQPEGSGSIARQRAMRSTSSASCATPRASGPGRPSRSRPGRRSWSAACSAGSAPMACGASAPPTAPCRGRTARARCRPGSASTCWSPTASRAPRSTPPPPAAIRRASCSTRPSAWSAPPRRSSAGSAS